METHPENDTAMEFWSQGNVPGWLSYLHWGSHVKVCLILYVSNSFYVGTAHFCNIWGWPQHLFNIAYRQMAERKWEGWLISWKFQGAYFLPLKVDRKKPKLLLQLAAIWFIIWQKWNLSGIGKAWNWNEGAKQIQRRAEETPRKLTLREDTYEGPGVFVALRCMSGQTQKLALELSSHLGARFVSITITYKKFPRNADKFCHAVPAMGELKHRVKPFDQSHTGKLRQRKVQNLISWEPLRSLIHKSILPCWVSCLTMDLGHCKPLFQQEIHILGFAWTRLKGGCRCFRMATG